jgi:hypothetical protein
MKVYIVMVEWGVYADHSIMVDETFKKKSDAEKYMKKKQDESIKNKTKMNYWIEEREVS